MIRYILIISFTIFIRIIIKINKISIKRYNIRKIRFIIFYLEIIRLSYLIYDK